MLAFGNTLNLSDTFSDATLNHHFINEPKDEVSDAIKKAGSLCDVDEEEIDFNDEDRMI